ncbi:MAG: exosortase/archaeosortase family protein [Acidobacteriia bacterium]|nr:exosortase/archaeosortase family protein [Terriglobia bacterium]
MEGRAPAASRGIALDLHGLLQLAVLAALVVFLYYRILAGLVAQWLQDPNYSHGFFIPFFCAWVIWREREHLAKAPAKGSWTGLLVILGALSILVLGVLGAENFLSRTSLLFLLAGLVIYFRGWGLFRAWLFPWVILFLMIPLPAIIFNQIALPLQFQASGLASGLLSLAGIPVLREGNVIHLPSLTLDVVEACSGLRSLVSLLTLAVIYAYLFEPRLVRRALLILSAVPIAVLANGFRIMGSGILGEYWSPEKAEGFFHMFSGLLIFCVSFSLLLLFHAAVSWLGRRLPARNT